MEKIVLAIKDKKNTYLDIYTVPNELVGLRDFSAICTNKDTQIAKYPDDYALYCLGRWNMATGALEPQEPKLLGEAKSYIQK